MGETDQKSSQCPCMSLFKCICLLSSLYPSVRLPACLCIHLVFPATFCLFYGFLSALPVWLIFLFYVRTYLLFSFLHCGLGAPVLGWISYHHVFFLFFVVCPTSSFCSVPSSSLPVLIWKMLWASANDGEYLGS